MAVDIKALRRRLGIKNRPISQEELGRRLGGLSQATVSRMETGELPQEGPVAVLLAQLDAAAPDRAAA